MIWWRVDSEVAKRMWLGGYLLALLFAAIAVPLISLVLTFVLGNSSLAINRELSSIAIFGIATAFFAWIYLLATIPFFFLARKTGYIGLLPILIIAIVLALPLPLYNVGYTDISFYGGAFHGVYHMMGFALLYASITWFICLKLHGNLFT